jgi:HNH endonuclease
MAKGTCLVESCERTVLARGWCSVHYARWKVSGEPAPQCSFDGCINPSTLRGLCQEHRVLTHPPCSVEGCTNPSEARGWCMMHWKRWYKHGDPTFVTPPRVKVVCIVASCDNPALIRGYCSMHIQRLLKHGDPEYTPSLAPRCAFDGCTKPGDRQGWCGAHYARWKRWGDPAGKRALNGTIRVDGYGYQKLTIDGKDTFVHRIVMEDEILGRPLLRTESVHHKNGNRQDNRPENLELWVQFQPSGQRVEDLVAWAHEILTRYGTYAEQMRLALEDE